MSVSLPLAHAPLTWSSVSGIDPVAFHLGPLQVHWYGIMYLIGFLCAWGLARLRVRRDTLDWTPEQISDLIFYAACGVIAGGRLGYMFFYNFDTLLHHPLQAFKVWEGGMSFHGGLMGVLAALWFFSRQTGKPFLIITDFVAPLVPIGLGLGRLGNFINGELWGRVSDVPWGMVFPRAGDLPRHPSQLYELFLEGFVLFCVLWVYAARKPKTGRISALFLIGYALCRIIVEFFREPDWQLGYLAFGWFTMGQLLSLPMLLLGFYLWRRAQ